MEATMTQAPLRSDFLSVDEDMEISSEAGRGAESDIEIFDLDDDAATVTNDDEMIDDQEHDVKDEDMNEEFPRETTVDMDDEIVFDEDIEIAEVEDTATTSETKDFALNVQQSRKDAPPSDAPDETVQGPSMTAHSAQSDTVATAIANEHQTAQTEDTNPHTPQENVDDLGDHNTQEHVDDAEDHTPQNQVDEHAQADPEAADAVAASALEATAVAEGEVDTGEAAEAAAANAGLEALPEEGQPAEKAAEPDSGDAAAEPAGTIEASQSDSKTKVPSTAVDKAEYVDESATTAAEPLQDAYEDAEQSHVAESAQEGVHEAAAEATLSPSLSHEVRVMYEGNDMSLFPPKDPQDTRTYMLQDSALLHSAVAELFPACRAVLGQSISEKDELQLEIPDLGLRLGEKSSRQPSSTLSDVVDVYLALSYNDSSEEPGPLYLHLDVLPDFQTKLDTLHELASDGKGFSSLIEPVDSGEEDEEWAELSGNAGPENASTASVTESGAEHGDAKAEAGVNAVPAKVEDDTVESVVVDATENVAAEASGASKEEATEEHFELDLHAANGHDATEAAPTAVDADEDEEDVDGKGEDEEDDDFIDYTDDEEDGGTPLTPSISHKRSWDEHAETEEEATEGSATKKAKTSAS